MTYYKTLIIATTIAFSTIPVAILTIMTKHMEYFWIPIPMSFVALGMVLIPLFQNEKPSITSGGKGN